MDIFSKKGTEKIIFINLFSLLYLGTFRQLLLNVQVSTLFDTRTKMRFALPSAIAPEAVKIYKLMDVPIRRLAYVL